MRWKVMQIVLFVHLLNKNGLAFNLSHIFLCLTFFCFRYTNLSLTTVWWIEVINMFAASAKLHASKLSCVK